MNLKHQYEFLRKNILHAISIGNHMISSAIWNK